MNLHSFLPNFDNCILKYTGGSALGILSEGAGIVRELALESSDLSAQIQNNI